MRSIEHPGPVHPERIECIAARVHAMDVVLPRGTVLRDGVVDVLSARGAGSAVLSIRSGSLDPLAYVFPAIREGCAQILWYSETQHAQGEAVVQGGCITLGSREGQPMLHCHATWRDASGQTFCGHLWPHETRVRQDLHLQAWLLDGAQFVVAKDAETHFDVFHLVDAPEHLDTARAPSRPALALRLRPNQDICLTLEQLCVQHGIRRARIRSGVGSLIGAQFTDGRSIEPFATETFIHDGSGIAPDADGKPACTIHVTSVDHLGGVNSGTLMRGQNPVLITFELALEIVERA